MAAAEHSTVRTLGVPCFAGSVEAAAHAVVARARSGAGGYACLSNVHVLVSAHHDADLRAALDAAWMVFPDGWPVAWLQRRAGAPGAARVAGADLMALVCVIGQPLGLRHYLLGSTPETLGRLERRLRAGYPDLVLAGSYAPPLAPVDRVVDAAALEAVRAAEPDVVWCGLGAPKQELWMGRAAEALAPAVALGVGAAFDFLAGTKPRAPRWMQQRSLEWLHRLGLEPRRLAGRYVRTNAEFALRAGVELSRRRRAA